MAETCKEFIFLNFYNLAPCNSIVTLFQQFMKKAISFVLGTHSKLL